PGKRDTSANPVGATREACRTGGFARFFRLGGTIAMVKRLLADDELMECWIEFLSTQPEFKLIHEHFTPLADKLAMVKEWPGINPDDVEAALATAMENGTIAGYESEVPKNKHLDIVVTPYRESVAATLVYLRDRMKEAHGDRYWQWPEAYDDNVDENRVKLIDGAAPFIPNRIVIEVVDFGANWNRKDGLILESVQKAQASKLAGFAVIANASQSPRWVQKMDGETVPYALAAALLLSVPGHDSWRYSPNVWHNGGRAKLYGYHVEDQFNYHAMPVLQEYKP
ncbi:MAG TPA: hypothetical protein PLK06_03515, partial [bacterium]|nr:hypothetical protein [bacterium]